MYLQKKFPMFLFLFNLSLVNVKISRVYNWRNTILDKIFGTKWRNPVKLDRARKVWYLLLRVFWLLLLKFNFWNEDWALGYVSTKIWDFPNISLFPKILSLKSFGNSEATHMQVCRTGYHVSFYLWLIGSVLKHCKVPKYFDQDCR